MLKERVSFMGVMAGGTAARPPPTDDSCMASDTVVMWKLFGLPFPKASDCLLRLNFGNCFLGTAAVFELESAEPGWVR